MSTYSVYNIKIDNNLSFTPGATAGYVLAIDSNGNTYWAPAGSGGGSQTLAQTLALGNNVGTYSIIGTDNLRLSVGASPSSFGSVLTINKDELSLNSGGVPGGPWYGSYISVGTSSVSISAVDDNINSSSIQLYNENIYLNGISGTGSNFLTIGSNGSIGITSSTGNIVSVNGYFLRSTGTGTTASDAFYFYPDIKASNAQRVGIEAKTVLQGGLNIELLAGATGSGWAPININANASGDATIQFEFDSINPPNAPKIMASKTSNTNAGLDFYTSVGDLQSLALSLKDGVYLTGISSSFLAADSTGKIIATASTGGGGFGSFGITIDGGGSVITTGVKGYVTVPYSGTITGWTLLSDVSGSIVIDVWKDTYSVFPPSVADTIAGSEKPTLTSANKNQNLSLSTWTTSITAGDIIGFNVDSATTLTRVNLAINITKS